ncbi:MAG: FAD-dependent oxidoreductase [Pseudomonadota bacterium]
MTQRSATPAQRAPLCTLRDSIFDVVVVGAGINGCSAAQHLAAAGYHVLLLDKGDIASGSSGRSSGLLHCGLRYLEPSPDLWTFAKRPDRLVIALKMARQAMKDRSAFVTSKPGQAKLFTFYFPVYRNTSFKKWQIDLALKTLEAIGGDRQVPLGRLSLARDQVAAHPLLRHLRDRDALAGVAGFREYRFDWPERIAVDLALDARDLGARLHTYTRVERLERRDDGHWVSHLKDSLTGETTHVTSPIVLNTAGIWMDGLLGRGGRAVKPLINGTKGAHIAFKLAPELAGFGIATINRIGLPFYVVPWRGLHYVGPTETPYDSPLDQVAANDQDIAFLLDEAKHLLPGLGLRRQDILFTWAGVRPLGADPRFPEGKRAREIHDLADQGLPNVLAMTAGPIMTHRSAGRELTEAVRPRLAPTRDPVALTHRARVFPENQNAPPLLDHFPDIKESHVAFAAEHELPESLCDIMVRRIGALWSETNGWEAAPRAAEIAGERLGWDEARRAREVEAYRSFLKIAVGRQDL